MNSTSHTTLLEAVRKSLELAGRSAPGDAIAPAALLWANFDAQWQSLVDQFCPLMPLLLTLVDYNHKERLKLVKMGSRDEHIP